MKKFKILTLGFCLLCLINCACYAKELENVDFTKVKENVEIYSNCNEESHNKKYAIIKTYGFKNFESTLTVIKNIKDSNLLDIKTNVKKLDKLFSDFICFYECSNKK